MRKIAGRKAASSNNQIFTSSKRGRDHPERSSEVMFHVYRYLAKEKRFGLQADDAVCDAFQLAVLRWQPFRIRSRR